MRLECLCGGVVLCMSEDSAKGAIGQPRKSKFVQRILSVTEPLHAFPGVYTIQPAERTFFWESQDVMTKLGVIIKFLRALRRKLEAQNREAAHEARRRSITVINAHTKINIAWGHGAKEFPHVHYNST